MAKYSYEFKKQVVDAYLCGEGGYTLLAEKYGIKNRHQVLNWVHYYEQFGDEGLLKSRKNENYSFEFKLHVVELYLSSELSYQEVALSSGINNNAIVCKWVNEYRVAGPDALRPRKKGRKKTLETSTDKNKVLPDNPVSVDTSTEHVKELEDELLKLKIENAFFKRTEEAAFRGRGKNERIARVIHSLRGEFRLKVLLSYSGMPKATYMYWQKRFDRVNPDKEIENKIMEIHENNKDYGYRRMYGELRNQGMLINKKKVQRIMQKLNLQVLSYTRKSRKYSSYKGNVGTVAPNRIRRRFHTHIPHQKITTDTTEFKYYEVDAKGHMTMHKLYLDPFMDMCNGEIISYGIAKRPTAANVMNALNKAIEITSDCPYRRTFHSDRGWAYQMGVYLHRLKEERIYQSMSRKGNCYDNSVMENFFGLLKQEIYYGAVYYSFEELKSGIERFIKYYNEQRIKEKLGWMSPVQYRLSLLAA
ncbi:IS3 family transposase [Blautia pseudococcoides]|uniref:IS3 family transposase n=1 Tax=Blautia pseudococcoides TaxID=1796616 RepID=UPI001FA82A17|nr:IS3 family transposase [Blautia pseudococcoides]